MKPHATNEQDTRPRIASRYRKIEVRTWGDEKFLELSPIPPCGQGLWLFLITGPHTSPIPGLSRAGRASMAEELGWDLKAFDEAFGEAFGQGMVKADFRARLIWLPSAIKYNRPESPNVVRSWGAEFDLMPECDLKREAYETLKASISALGEAFAKAFDEAFAKPSGKPSPKPSRKAMPNQEQEQEQEQEQALPSSLRSDSSSDDDGPAQAEAGKPDLKLVPDAPADRKAALKARLRQITEDACLSYNAILARPNGLLDSVRWPMGADTRIKQVNRCLDRAREISSDVFGSERLTREFWDSYFQQCAEDPHKSGRVGGGKGHENWLPDFEYLTRKDVMLSVFEKAMAA